MRGDKLGLASDGYTLRGRDWRHASDDTKGVGLREVGREWV